MYFEREVEPPFCTPRPMATGRGACLSVLLRAWTARGQQLAFSRASVPHSEGALKEYWTGSCSVARLRLRQNSNTNSTDMATRAVRLGGEGFASEACEVVMRRQRDLAMRGPCLTDACLCSERLWKAGQSAARLARCTLAAATLLSSLVCELSLRET